MRSWTFNKVCEILGHAWRFVEDEATQETYCECFRCGAVKREFE